MAPNETSFHRHDFSTLPVRDIYQLLVAIVVPRPIALVSTVSENGVTNLAPFSFYNAVSSKPPCLVFSIARHPDGKKKDTLRNIETNREFVVNTSELAFVKEINASSENLPYGVSEIEKVGLHTIPSIWVKPPRILDSAIQMECRLDQLVEIGEAEAGGSTLVIGRILGVHISEHVLENGKIMYEKLNPVARLGRDEWLRGGDIFRLPRP